MPKTVITLREARSLPIPEATGLHAPAPPADARARALRDLRISVTDRCNFRCTYCMPKEVFDAHYEFLPHAEVLSFEEIVRMAARSDISEELERFRGHVTHWAALADGPEPCGRKLDFLLQEMNREVNTMGSKADGLRVSELIIAAKAELEKMREQVQNVE